jgi:DNA-binding NarL/FixJ family response regulator
MNVLLIDDSDIFRTRMRRRLEEEPGFRVVEARNGFEGLIEIEKARPGVVLLDLHMPGMDGFTILGEIRERYADLSVIVLSANLTPAARNRCRELGAQGIVDKTDAASAVMPAIRTATGAALQERL